MRGRRRKIDHGVRLVLYVPESIHAKVHQQLYSEIEGRVPHGAITALGTELFTNWLREKGILL